MSLGSEFNPATFSGEVPLFPLPGCVLLPGALLPLHVFEPRYRLMVRDALSAERLIAMAFLQPGYEQDYQNNPEIDPHVCVGRIVLEQELPDGRFQLVLVGVHRARVLEEDRSRPYRVARVELYGGDAPAGANQDREHVRWLLGFLEQLPAQIIRDARRMSVLLGLLSEAQPRPIGLGLALDLAADAVHLGVADRLEVLRCGDVQQRRRVLTELLQRVAQELRPPRRWPPKISNN